jgi:hypothetical protein
MIQKGDIVGSTRFDQRALVLAVTKDGLRAKLHVFGYDREVWRDIAVCSVETTGEEECWQCGGHGLYFFGGAVVNGVYQGSTGPCYGCGGTGMQTNADRLRCYYYWHRGGAREAMPTA